MYGSFLVITSESLYYEQNKYEQNKCTIIFLIFVSLADFSIEWTIALSLFTQCV